MSHNNVLNYIKEVLQNMPSGWLLTTTHRLDIYNEELAKTQFLNQFDTLYSNSDFTSASLAQLPTAYDCIRLGHPLSCVLEWAVAKVNHCKSENVISFSSQTVPVLAVLRKNLFDNRKTRIIYKDELPAFFDSEIIKSIYGYQFELQRWDSKEELAPFEGSTLFISKESTFGATTILDGVDFYLALYENLGSILIVQGTDNEHYISDIQHVRRRETIAMTPDDCLTALQAIVADKAASITVRNIEK